MLGLDVALQRVWIGYCLLLPTAMMSAPSLDVEHAMGTMEGCALPKRGGSCWRSKASSP